MTDYQLKMRRERSRRFREKKAAAGLCVRCDEPRIPGKAECVAHNDATVARTQARYKRHREAGKCGTCGKPSAGKSLCTKCYAQTTEATRQRKARYKASGRCVNCGKPAVQGQTNCVACAARYVEQQRARFFGLTVEQLRAVLAPGKCAICGATGELHVDHDHATGRVRGILCERHNLGIGQFADNPDHLKRAAEYLCPSP